MAAPAYWDVLRPAELEQIHEGSLAILSDVGLDILDPVMREILHGHGARVDGERVRFPRALVLDALQTVPKRFTLHARNPQHTVEIGGPEPVFAAGYGAPFVFDRQRGRRRGTLQDYRDLTRLVQCCPHIQMPTAIICEPQDVDEPVRHLQMTLTQILNTDKPYFGNPLGYERVRDVQNMVAIAYQNERIFAERTVLLCLINVISPLRYDDRMLGCLRAQAEQNQPIVAAPFAMGGASAPMTLAGIVMQANAEALAAVVMTQCVRKGAPIIYGNASSILDMRTAVAPIGAPETALLIAATGQLGRYYGIPSRAGGCLNDSKTVDGQSAYESMMTMMSAVQSGVRFILHSAGMLESYLTIGYEKLLIDHEMLAALRRLIRGIEVNPDTLALDLIREIGPGRHFLETDHTMMHYRTEIWYPDLADRWAINDWIQQGSRSIEERATARWQELLASFTPPELPAGVAAELDRYVAEAAERITREMARGAGG